MTRDERAKDDARKLILLPEFRRFMWRVIQTAGIYSRTTDGADGRNLSFAEGRRHLGLDILDMAESGQAVSHPDGTPVLTLIQILHEEANQPQEKRNERYDRNTELTE